MTWWIISQEGAVFFSWDSLVVCFSFDSPSALFQNPFTQWAVVQLCPFCLPPTIVKAEAGSLCDRNSQEQQRERKRKRIRVCATNWRYQIALPFIPPLISLPFMRKECTAGLLAHVRCRQFFSFLFLNPWTYIRSLLPRQLVSSDCVLLQGRERKKRDR